MNSSTTTDTTIAPTVDDRALSVSTLAPPPPHATPETLTIHYETVEKDDQVPPPPNIVDKSPPTAAQVVEAAGAEYATPPITAQPSPVHIAPGNDPTTYDTPPPADPRTVASRRGAERYHASVEQLKHLMAAFDENPCPTVTTLNYLSETIDMPMHNLVLWFKNRRARSKKNLRVPGQRRSYVKSGIYSRTRRTPAKHEHQAVMHVPTIDDHHVATHDRFDPTAAYPDIAAPHDHDPSAPVAPIPLAPAAKRARISNLAIDDPASAALARNACRNWSSMHCLQAFTNFFNKHTGGQHAEQAKAAHAVASQFFLAELQSGLTVTSLVQPMKVSVDILDALIEKRASEGQQPPLSSGSRAILGEFLVQIRSGEATAYESAKPFLSNQRMDTQVEAEAMENGACVEPEESANDVN